MRGRASEVAADFTAACFIDPHPLVSAEDVTAHSNKKNLTLTSWNNEFPLMVRPVTSTMVRP
jgi:hypothetical protein